MFIFTEKLLLLKTRRWQPATEQTAHFPVPKKGPRRNWRMMAQQSPLPSVYTPIRLLHLLLSPFQDPPDNVSNTGPPWRLTMTTIPVVTMIRTTRTTKEQGTKRTTESTATTVATTMVATTKAATMRMTLVATTATTRMAAREMTPAGTSSLPPFPLSRVFYCYFDHDAHALMLRRHIFIFFSFCPFFLFFAFGTQSLLYDDTSLLSRRYIASTMTPASFRGDILPLRRCMPSFWGFFKLPYPPLWWRRVPLLLRGLFFSLPSITMTTCAPPFEGLIFLAYDTHMTTPAPPFEGNFLHYHSHMMTPAPFEGYFLRYDTHPLHYDDA